MTSNRLADLVLADLVLAALRHRRWGAAQTLQGACEKRESPSLKVLADSRCCFPCVWALRCFRGFWLSRSEVATDVAGVGSGSCIDIALALALALALAFISFLLWLLLLPLLLLLLLLLLLVLQVRR